MARLTDGGQRRSKGFECGWKLSIKKRTIAMPDSPNTSGEPAGERHPLSTVLNQGGRKPDEPSPPESKALKVFLIVALVITGAAYLTNEWIEITEARAHAKHPNALRKLVQSQSDFLQHTQLGRTAMARKRFDQAVSEFRQALQAQQSAEGYVNLGSALLQQGNPEPAVADFRQAVQLDPKMVTAYDLWGRALVAQGKPDEAANIYQQALQHEPDSGVIHYDLALALQQMQCNAEASARAANSSGKTAEARTDLAQAENYEGQALQNYVKASRMGIDSAEFWTGYGQLLNQAGKYADAEIALKRAVTEGPNIAKAHFELALAESRLGNYAETIAHYEKVLSLTPDDPETLNALALLYTTATNSEVRSPKMAVALATRACDATTSQNAGFMDTLARAYAADGDFFQAITSEDKAIKRAAQLSDHALTRELQARYQLYLDHKSD